MGRAVASPALRWGQRKVKSPWLPLGWQCVPVCGPGRGRLAYTGLPSKGVRSDSCVAKDTGGPAGENRKRVQN